MAETQTTTTDLAVRSSTDLAQVAELESILLETVEVPDVVEDPEAISKAIMLEMLSATSDEELQQFGTAVGWHELEGLPIVLEGFKWRRSEFYKVDDNTGPPVYFIVYGTRTDDGSAVTLTTGSRNVLAQLVNMARRGTMIGSTWKLERAEKKTSRGYQPFWLRKVADAPDVSDDADTDSES